MPGNIGIRTVDLLPVQISKLYKDRKNLKETLACDLSNANPPGELTAADKVDYPSDDESDEEIDFELEIPQLGDLINQFEKDDITLAKIEKDIQMKRDETKLKGFKLRETETVIDEKELKLKLLNDNIAKQREEWSSTLPSLIQGLNATIKDPLNKANVLN